MKPDYYSVLVRVIAAATQDPAQTRRVIYELARINLKKELWLQYGEFGGTGMRQQMMQLETAIRAVEARCAQDEMIAKLGAPPNGADGARPEPGSALPYHQQAPDTAPSESEAPSWVVHERSGDNALVIHPSRARAMVQPHPAPPAYMPDPLPAPQMPPPSYAPPPIPRRIASSLWSMAQLVIAAVLGVAIYAAASGRFESLKFQSPLRIDAAAEKPAPVAETPHKKQERVAETPAPELKLTTAVTEPPALARLRTPGLPLPTVYGVFALNNGQLSELETLAIRVPDQRVSISAPISTPSRTLLPDGRVAFVLYRRDFVTNAPEKASIRVIARIARALTFNSSGTPTVVKLNDLWAVRGNSYEFRVQPVGDNPEMMVIRPDRDEFTLPPGRYALVIKGQAYDFTIDGKITDLAQCLERTDAVNGAFYSECRNP